MFLLVIGCSILLVFLLHKPTESPLLLLVFLTFLDCDLKLPLKQSEFFLLPLVVSLHLLDLGQPLIDLASRISKYLFEGVLFKRKVGSACPASLSRTTYLKIKFLFLTDLIFLKFPQILPLVLNIKFKIDNLIVEFLVPLLLFSKNLTVQLQPLLPLLNFNIHLVNFIPHLILVLSNLLEFALSLIDLGMQIDVFATDASDVLVFGGHLVHELLDLRAEGVGPLLGLVVVIVEFAFGYHMRQ